MSVTSLYVFRFSPVRPLLLLIVTTSRRYVIVGVGSEPKNFRFILNFDFCTDPNFSRWTINPGTRRYFAWFRKITQKLSMDINKNVQWGFGYADCENETDQSLAFIKKMAAREVER